MNGPDSPIDLQRVESVALAYHLLAHLDLGRDAASLFDRRLPDRPWRDPLHRAYMAAPGRLIVHALPLLHSGRLEHALRHALPSSLHDAAGRRLAACFADAMEAERPEYSAAFEASTVSDRVLRERVHRQIGSDLHRLRAALWERQGPPPPLRVYDCRSLGPAGRAASTPTGRVVAVSLNEPIDHVLCQILHEEIHAITDPVVRATTGEQLRDTRAGTPGHAVHEALERAAIEVGDALVAARAPRFSAAYSRWRRRFEA